MYFRVYKWYVFFIYCYFFINICILKYYVLVEVGSSILEMKIFNVF